MPFRSKAQMRYFFAAEQRGELPKGTARRWAHETPNLKSLPERVSKKKKKSSIYGQDTFNLATDMSNQEESSAQEQQKSEQERYEESLRNYRKAYLRAKLVGSLIGFMTAGFTPKNIRDLGLHAGIGPLAATLLYGAAGLSTGLFMSEVWFPWAVRPISRATNRAVAGLVLGGLHSFFRRLTNRFFWGYPPGIIPTSDIIEDAALLAQKDAPHYAAIAPFFGLIWDWMHYGSSLTPVPKRPS